MAAPFKKSLAVAAQRRAKANAEFDKTVVAAVKGGNPVTFVAEHAGITRPTVYAILNRNKGD
jgi:DNA invertase Pin-like site-specific DNA recombinase